MSIRAILGLFAIAAVAGCSSGSEPQQFGSLDSRITRGERQTYTAGGDTPEIVIDLVYRNPLTGVMRHTKPPLWERVVLPRLAHALQTVGVTVKAQPNSVVCVREDQTVLVPAVRCVNSDLEGNTRFDFLATTKAGTHMALIQATYGLETTVPDTVQITVLPDVFADSPLLRYTSFPGRPLPATFSPEVALDKYGNPVPYRLVVMPDAYGEAATSNTGGSRLFAGFKVFARTQSDTLGTTGARTIVLDSIIGPHQINGFNVVRVCGAVQVVTASGVSASGFFSIGSRENPSSFGLYANYYAPLADRTSCP